MQPPFVPDTNVPDSKAPVSVWHRQASYDTAKACEKGKEERIRRNTKVLNADPSPRGDAVLLRETLSLLAARCVPAGQIYAPAK